MSTKSSVKDEHYEASLSSLQPGRNWRNVIFIPYKLWWKIFVICTVLLNIFISLFYLVFSNVHSSLTFTIPFYACESIYFTDVVLTIMHRFMKTYRRKQLQHPRHALLLTIDIISLLPFYELYYIVEHCSYGDEGAAARDYMKLKVILRLLYAISFYQSIRNHPGVNQIVVVIFGQFYIMQLYIIFGASLWYLASTHKDSRLVQHISELQIGQNTSMHWFLICVSIIGNPYMHSSAGLASIHSFWEYLIYIVTMLFGCLMHVMIFFGDLTTQHIQKYQHQLEFSNRLSIIIEIMRNWQTDEDSQKKTIEHYSKYWEMRQGMKDMPSGYWNLPVSMRKEITLDLFWDCFIHTQFFQDCEMNFKRSLSIHMYTEFYLPGDYLFCANQMKHKMAYLSSGIVQILSQEDQQSPVMSFSSGTLFGEIATMLLVPSLINLRCATYCEIQTLDLRHLCFTMVQYRKAAKNLHEKFNNRINDAKMMQHPILLKMKDKQQKRTSIRWLKNQWRLIYKQTKKKTADTSEIPITPCHMSNYLNMYALSGDVELKERVICLKSTCPYVMEPASSFRKFFDYVIVVVVVVQCTIIPYIVFFTARMSNGNAGFFYMLDFVYIFGLYLDMSTAIKTKEILITDPQEIIVFKTKQMSVLLDILGTFPLELFGYAMGSSNYTCMLLHLNRIFKMHRIHTFQKAAENSLLSKAVRLRLIKFSVIFGYCAYSLGCLVYGVACPENVCYQVGWFSYFAAMNKQGNISSSQNMNFTVSFTYTVGLLLGLLDNAMHSYTLTDIVLGLLITFLGYCIFSFCFSELTACTVIHLQDSNDFQDFLKVLKILNQNPDVPSLLRKNMYAMTMCEWNYSKRHAISGENGILIDAPDNLKKSILYQRIVDCLLKVPLFQECERSILWNIAASADLNVIPPDTLIGREDTYQNDLKIILRGYCRVETSIPTDSYRGNYSIYSTGDVFPLMEELLDINTFLKVISITFAEIACIPFQAICNQFENNDPDFYKDLNIMLKIFVQEHDTILMRRKGRLPEMVSSRKSYGKGEYFSYETNEEFDDVEIGRVQNVISGKWKFTQRFFLKTTVFPKKLFYTIWECFRCFISVINILYTLTVIKYFIAAGIDIYLQLFFLVIALVDWYIRMHCQYYNDKGILVTHPWYTAKNYITGAFIMDLYANFPVTLVGLQSMFYGAIGPKLLVFVLILTRPFQIYRIYYGIEYIQNRSKEEKAVLFERIKHIIMICVILFTLSACLEHFACDYFGKGSSNYTCAPHSWIMGSTLGHNLRHVDAIILSQYKVLSLFTTCDLGITPLRGFWEICVAVVYVFILFAVKWVTLAKIVSSAIKGNTKLTLYQHNVNIMVKYLRNYLIDEMLIKEVVDHYENLFNRSQGYDINNILRSFFTVMYADYTYYMYWPVLQTADLFYGSQASDMRYLCRQFKQYSYKKDAQIIRCNDVQDFCYIVYKGRVRISIAGTKLKTLYPGGTFGSYQRGKTRQTITATAMVHVEVLCIQSRTLNSLTQKFPLLREKLKKAQYLKTEFMGSSFVDENKQTVVYTESAYVRKWTKFLIDPGNKYYSMYNYLLCVHISTITSMIVVMVVARMDTTKSYYLYVADLIFLSRIIVKFHLIYVDHETGILVKSFKSIAKKYLTEWTGFWFDVFTCFPFEFIAKTITHNRMVYTCCWINRSIRCFHLIVYYNNCKNKLTVSKTLKWTYLMYTMVIVIHFMTTVWWLISCPNDVCYHLSNIHYNDTEYKKSNNFALNFRVSYMYVISIFSVTGTRKQIPMSAVEVTISILILIASQVMVYTLTSGFANILRFGKYVLNNYERDIDHIHSFMKNANVSLPIVHKVRAHLIVLWLHYSGVSMPTLIAQAPGYLKQDIMYALYGYHITNHTLFSKTHMDFIRQLLVHMIPQVYLPGQYIIEKGDIDGRMYFIHDGEVRVLDKHGNNEIEQFVLFKGSSFGEYQAIKNMEHSRSVRTSVMCIIISLKTSDWSYLLDWFPASKEIIESKLVSFSPGQPASS